MLTRTLASRLTRLFIASLGSVYRHSIVHRKISLFTFLISIYFANCQCLIEGKKLHRRPNFKKSRNIIGIFENCLKLITCWNKTQFLIRLMNVKTARLKCLRAITHMQSPQAIQMKSFFCQIIVNRAMGIPNILPSNYIFIFFTPSTGWPWQWFSVEKMWLSVKNMWFSKLLLCKDVNDLIVNDNLRLQNIL